MNSPDMQDPLVAGALEGLLRWYVAMGADAAIDEEPHDRFAAPAPQPARGPALTQDAQAEEAENRDTPSPEAPRQRTLNRDLPAPAAAPRFESTPAADALIAQAEELAARAGTLEELRHAWENFQGCGLAATASQMIFSGGTPGAPIMILGAAPGSDDERQGEAFAGAAGRLIDGMLAAIGLSRGTVYLANVIPWRPPGNRQPTPLEAALCLPFTRRHIALANPGVILCLGEKAAQLLLGTKEPLARLRGRWLTYEDGAAPVKIAITYSPDYLLSQPLQKKRAWADLLAFAKMLEARTNSSPHA
jgi:uracil-DNA glycosylase family 4